ncbi:unnamed protein product [Camellia sinensis]
MRRKKHIFKKQRGRESEISLTDKQQHSPNPPSSSSSLPRDISNFKTPKHPSQNPNLHSPHPQFFTASKQTPHSSSILRRHRPSLASSSARSKVSRRLKAFELEQCKSVRKAQIDKEKSLKSLAKSLTVWLNFLLQNPVSCGCDLSKMAGQYGFEESDVKLVSGNGKRASSRGGGVGVDTPWRCPKRQRDSGWRGVAREESTVFLNSKLLALQSSLRDVCSFDDLKERMKVYLSLGSCKEIFNVMTQVTKNIDEGRLKMKSHCPIVTDVGLKEKASRILIAKSQSCLPIKYGIDGLDGGSPLLFTLQPNIKSSCQVIHDFLSSDVMHGEGNVLAHLVIVGYKVSYLQSPFNEYDFRVKELFEDLQDGVRLCRAIQLLQHDASILMKMLVPSDTRKKNVVNCGVALQQLKQAGVPLFDEDGSMIVAEDIVSGDKELTLSLLWNIFVHLLPLLINKTLILEEISRIQGVNAEHLNNSTLLDMLLNWIQAICESYNFKVDNFASPVDGKAMWCLLDYYFRKELNCSCSLKDVRETSGETSIMSVSDYTDAVHSFILSQKLTTLLGNFPEVLQVSDILEHNGPSNSQSVIILLVFLSFQLLVRKNTRRRLSMDQCFAHSEAILNQEDRHVYNTEDGMRNFKAIMAWRQDMAMRNKRFNLRPGTPPLQFLSTRRSNSTMQREKRKQSGSHCRGWLIRKEIVVQKEAVIKIQSAFRCIQCQKLFDCYRHAAPEIQRFVRGQIARRRLLVHCRGWLIRKEIVVQKEAAFCTRNPTVCQGSDSLKEAFRASFLPKTDPTGCIVTSTDYFQNLELGMFLCSVLKLQRWWRVVLMHKSSSKSAIIIQSHIRGWIARQEATRFATNVDDSMRIINGLLVALSDLLSMKSVSGILHTCATLDMATKHSQKCCEKVVEAGAVDTLLKLILSVSRSIPDQEVLKHALSTLRNLARCSHLTEVLVRSRGFVETILWELLRNKDEGYFIASELLRKICLNTKGVEAARSLPTLLKRLHNLVEDLTRKTGNEKRRMLGSACKRAVGEKIKRSC